MDTWEYFLHRLFHTNKFLYRHFHSVHHRLYVPYAFGALYNHWFEGLLLDTVGAGISHGLSFMTIRQGIFLFTFSTIKTVDDHCGYALPFDPLQWLFPNNASYHDVHHQVRTSVCSHFCVCAQHTMHVYRPGGSSTTSVNPFMFIGMQFLGRNTTGGHDGRTKTKISKRSSFTHHSDRCPGRASVNMIHTSCSWSIIIHYYIDCREAQWGASGLWVIFCCFCARAVGNPAANTVPAQSRSTHA